jgi:glycosyltransferase involved in cell wall biosynthesis
MESILHLGKFSHGQGGIETAINHLVEGLSPFFSLLKVAANNRFKTETLAQSLYLEYRVPFLGLLARTPICPTLPCFVKKLHERFQFSMLHLHLPNPMAHVASEMLPRSVKRIISWHSDVVQQKKWLHIYQPWVNRLLKQAATVIVATPYLAENSAQLSIARERNIIQIIPYGIDFAYFSPHPYKKKIEAIRHRFQHCFIVFSLGRHVAYKGFCYLIEAMAQLPSDLILVLGGEGPLTANLQQQVKKLNLEQRVHFLGNITKEDLPVYYHACDVFCLPSIDQSEAFGIVQLEAMACAKPIISCDLMEGNALNQDGRTGFLVSPSSSNALANAIEKFYRDPFLGKKLGRVAYVYAQKRFTLQVMIQRMKLLYEKILEST